MLRKFNRHFFLTAVLSLSVHGTVSQANVLVNAPPPYPQSVFGDSAFTIYYAGNQTGIPTAGANSINVGQGFRFITTAAGTNALPANLIFLDVSIDQALTVPTSPPSTIAVTLTTGGSGTEIALIGAGQAVGSTPPPLCTVGGNCYPSGTNTAAYYGATPGTILRLAFSLDALCASGTGALCTGNAYSTMSATTLNVTTLKVTFGVIPTASIQATDVTTATTNANSVFTFGMTDTNPTVACPLSGLITDEYFPGDQQISLLTGNFQLGAGTNVNPGSAPTALQSVIAMGSISAATPEAEAGGLSSPIVSYVDPNGGIATITGFTNTTTGPGGDNEFSVRVQSQNIAGLMSAAGSSCNVFPVQSQNISGVLANSKCFIATAAYHDGNAAPVMMLRKFRDQVLSHTSLGRSFIDQYYKYSPALAEWAWDKPIIRSIALRALAPIELIAWAILKFSHGEEILESPKESYIDRVKKTLPSSSSDSGSYTEQERVKLNADHAIPANSDEPYLVRVKKKLADEEDIKPATNYTINEREKLPLEEPRESPITLVKEGRDKGMDLGKIPDIKNAAGFKIGLAPGMQITSPTSVHTFTEVYGTGWQPEFLFHFEHQLFHSENFGSLALGGDFGIGYAGGTGLLEFGFGAGGSKVSHTGFGFLQFPVIVNATYRFNLLRILRPYITVGPGTILYDEFRNDKRPDKKGYSFVYSGNLGVSLLMDFLDSSTHRDAYLADGIQHTYLFAEYLYLNTFTTDVVFQRSGVYSGFTFEF